ncbi:somatostatin receptor type 4-like [Gigantopelta aegis]|uniref:somatostatin receptor type 4-like n=1 Tax=Gigantopelta aegis TaxID=1735272 RepID=UPI001B8875D0|nr:somatostatin receptor type 4-like [Gigantopelta aegis]
MDSNSSIDKYKFLDLLKDDYLYICIMSFQKAIIPIVCLIGTFGNLLSIIVLLGKVLRDKSCCVYLAAKCIADTVFLVALFVVWLARVDVHLFNLHGVCQMVIFITYICGFLSVWCIVFITLENYIRIAHFTRVPQLCKPDIARGVILAMCLVSVVIYNFPLWTAGSIQMNGTAKCVMLKEYVAINKGLTYMDTAVTLVLPSLVIITLLVAIIMNIYECYKKRKRLRRLGRHDAMVFLCDSPHSRVTKMLFAVSSVFILLHTPSHAIRIRLIIMFFLKADGLKIDEFRLQRVFELFYYANFSLNCFIYLCFGITFRHIFCSTYLKSCLSYKAKRKIHRHLKNIIQENQLEKKNGVTILYSNETIWEKVTDNRESVNHIELSSVGEVQSASL